MTITTIADIKPAIKNARRRTERGAGMIARSIEENGFGRSVLLANDGSLIAGSGTIDGCADVGLENVIVVPSDGTKIIAVQRTDVAPGSERAHRLAIADNRTTDLSDFDPAVVAALADEVDLSDFWRDDELDALLAGIETDAVPVGDDPGAQVDRAGELQSKWQVERGQLYEIGRHRLLCGDSTDAGEVARLMGDERAAITFTSPPYNAGDAERLTGNTHTTDTKYIGGGSDDLCADEYLSLLSCFTLVALQYAEYVFVNIQALAGNKLAFLEYWYAMRDRFCDVAVWDKGHAQPAMAGRVMNSQFEFILVFSSVNPCRAVGTRDWRGDVNNVYIAPPQRNNEYADVNAATFPLHLPTWGIETFSNAGEIVYEPFTGTGTTIVAAEQTGRRCYGIEIEPKYCAVILERMSGMGLTPRLVARDGTTE